MPFLICILVVLFILLIDEFSTREAIGNFFIHDKSLSLLVSILDGVYLNSIDNEILMCCNKTYINASCINDSCNTFLSKYYIRTEDGHIYRVYRWSKCHYEIKKKFQELLEKKPKQPKL